MSEKATNDNEASASPVAIVDEDVLRGKIHEIRGQKVMLDFELATRQSKALIRLFKGIDVR